MHFRKTSTFESGHCKEITQETYHVHLSNTWCLECLLEDSCGLVVLVSCPRCMEYILDPGNEK